MELTDAQRALVLDHIWIVLHHARRAGFGGEDVRQAGFLGLCDAASRWIPGGVGFTTFAWRRVRGAIQDHLRDGHKGDKGKRPTFVALGHKMADEPDRRVVNPDLSIDVRDAVSRLPAALRGIAMIVMCGLPLVSGIESEGVSERTIHVRRRKMFAALSHDLRDYAI